LKISDENNQSQFVTVAGLRTTQMTFTTDPVVITNKGSEGWRELLPKGGIKSVSISGAGVFTGSPAEVKLKKIAVSGSVDNFQVNFESGEKIQGLFQLTKLEYAGDFNAERTYTITLESAGQVMNV
jgi:TP901-1 family phage major tail protein